MIAENLNKFLPTILSRASVVKFSALPNKTVSDFLMTNINFLMKKRPQKLL